MRLCAGIQMGHSGVWILAFLVFAAPRTTGDNGFAPAANQVVEAGGASQLQGVKHGSWVGFRRIKAPELAHYFWAKAWDVMQSSFMCPEATQEGGTLTDSKGRGWDGFQLQAPPDLESSPWTHKWKTMWRSTFRWGDHQDFLKTAAHQYRNKRFPSTSGCKRGYDRAVASLGVCGYKMGGSPRAYSRIRCPNKMNKYKRVCTGTIARVQNSKGTQVVRAVGQQDYQFTKYVLSGKSIVGEKCEMLYFVRLGSCTSCKCREGMLRYHALSELSGSDSPGCKAWSLKVGTSAAKLFGLWRLDRVLQVLKKCSPNQTPHQRRRLRRRIRRRRRRGPSKRRRRRRGRSKRRRGPSRRRRKLLGETSQAMSLTQDQQGYFYTYSTRKCKSTKNRCADSIQIARCMSEWAWDRTIRIFNNSFGPKVQRRVDRLSDLDNRMHKFDRFTLEGVSGSKRCVLFYYVRMGSCTSCQCAAGLVQYEVQSELKTSASICQSWALKASSFAAAFFGQWRLTGMLATLERCFPGDHKKLSAEIGRFLKGQTNKS